MEINSRTQKDATLNPQYEYIIIQLYNFKSNKKSNDFSMNLLRKKIVYCILFIDRRKTYAKTIFAC
jgi:hypothetical protein